MIKYSKNDKTFGGTSPRYRSSLIALSNIGHCPRCYLLNTNYTSDYESLITVYVITSQKESSDYNRSLRSSNRFLKRVFINPNHYDYQTLQNFLYWEIPSDLFLSHENLLNHPSSLNFYEKKSLSDKCLFIVRVM